MDTNDQNPILETRSDQNDMNHNIASDMTSITTSDLSNILKEHGPLAIRHITKELSKIKPTFKTLSASKQRRLIINAMETGDIDNLLIFEKVGWGQWNIKKIDCLDNFNSQRDIMNKANLKKNFHKNTPNPLEGSGEVIISESDYEYDYEDELNTSNHSNNNQSLQANNRRRKSSVVFNDNYLDNYYHKNPSLQQDLKRRHSITQDTNNSFQGRRYSYSQEPFAFRDRKYSFTPPVKERKNSFSSIDHNKKSGFLLISPPLEEDSTIDSNFTYENKRRLSTAGKESSIRSTLLINNKETFFENSSNSNPLSEETTDEEDWASIGAASLRKRERFSSMKHPNGKLKENTDAAAKLLLSLKS